jgi:hypothetical protein
MRKRAKKPAKPKALTYVLIDRMEVGAAPGMYALLDELVERHHEDLFRTNARIALAWATSWKADVDGRLVLGKCHKASDLSRELAPWDFVILLNQEFWRDTRVSEDARRALLDHELCHAAVSYDATGEPKVDIAGRTLYRIRKHDLEEFSAIAARYGCWKKDIEHFAQQLAKHDPATATWVSYSALQQTLKSVGVTVPRDVIATWDDAERREVMTWALLRQDDRPVNALLSETMPPCLDAAVRGADASAH